MTKEFLSHFGFETLRDLPDMEALEDSGLLSKERPLAGEIPMAGLDFAEAEALADDEDNDISPEAPE